MTSPTTLDNWLTDPFDRRSFQRVRELVPTALITRYEGEPTLLPQQRCESCSCCSRGSVW